MKTVDGKQRRWSTVIAFAVSVFSINASGTTPRFDQLFYKGESVDVHQLKTGWLEMPWSKEVQALRVYSCSAIGGPRGKYQIDTSKP